MIENDPNQPDRGDFIGGRALNKQFFTVYIFFRRHPRNSQEKEERTVEEWCTSVSSKHESTGTEYRRPDVVKALSAIPYLVRVSRITSYNVCYTKLLRPQRRQDAVCLC